MANPNDFQNYHIGQKVIFTYNGKGLIVKDSAHGDWTLPGGRIDKDEDTITALKREMLEEISVDINELSSKPNLINVLPFEKYKIRHDGFVLMLHIYHIELTEEIKIEISDEHSDYEWITKDFIDSYDFLNEDLKKIIKQLLN